MLTFLLFFRLSRKHGRSSSALRLAFFDAEKPHFFRIRY